MRFVTNYTRGWGNVEDLDYPTFRKRVSTLRICVYNENDPLLCVVGWYARGRVLLPRHRHGLRHGAAR
jgi:hypothetical protein